VPLRLTVAVAFVDELLVMVSLPETVPVAAGLNCTVRLNVCLGLSVTGKLDPETVKPVPLIAAELIVTGPVPLEVSVTDSVDELPTVTLPKLRLDELTVNCGVVAMPVPLRLTVAVALVDELLVMVSLPETAPVAAGLNCTVRLNVCLGLSVTGKLDPETVKPVPLMAAELIVTGAVPLDVSVTDCVEEVPTVTLPKLKLARLTVKVGVVAAVPVPLRLTAAVASVDELLVMVSLPETAAALAGLNCTVRLSVCLGLRVTGKLAPETVKPAPVMVAELIVTAAVPVEVKVTDLVDEVPTVTLPKLRLVVLTVKVGVFAAAAPVPLRLTTVVPSNDESE
jgi:hypothetical protein